MKTTIEFLKKYSLVILAITVCSLSLFQISCGNQSKPQQADIDQSDKAKSKADSLYAVKAHTLLQEKDSIIKFLIAKLSNEKVNTETQKADARKQHILNDSLQNLFERDKDLSTCEDLVRGLKFEIIEKDSVIENLDSEINEYSSEVKELEEKVDIQKGVIDSKQKLIACKDSTINFYKTQKKKTNFWNQVKIKVAGAIVFIETIGLILK
ncbi:MAG: hypothetical protein PHR83_02760 [Paludibacter sp.]|nr:hypothetical protein [Paludibacter sp.]